MNRVTEVLELYGNRITVAGDILQAGWCFVPHTELRYREAGFRKHICNQDNLEILTAFMDVVLWDPGNWEDSIEAFCQDEGIKLRLLAQLVRIAITGDEHGPSLFGCLEFLGAVEVKNRVEFTIMLGMAGLAGVEFTEGMWL